MSSLKTTDLSARHFISQLHLAQQTFNWLCQFIRKSSLERFPYEQRNFSFQSRTVTINHSGAETDYKMSWCEFLINEHRSIPLVEKHRSERVKTPHNPAVTNTSLPPFNKSIKALITICYAFHGADESLFDVSIRVFVEKVGENIVEIRFRDGAFPFGVMADPRVLTFVWW